MIRNYIDREYSKITLLVDRSRKTFYICDSEKDLPQINDEIYCDCDSSEDNRERVTFIDMIGTAEAPGIETIDYNIYEVTTRDEERNNNGEWEDCYNGNMHYYFAIKIK